MRTSNYVIYVVLPKTGEMLLVHGYTGAVDVVSRRIGNALRFGWLSKIPADTNALLSRRGYLTELSADEESVHVCKLVNMLLNVDIRRPNFTFLISYDCNFSCPYCYEKELLTKSNALSGKAFSKPEVDAAYSAIEQLSSSDNVRFPIILFGGEPLLAKNKAIVRYIVSEGISRGYKFRAVTNGFELDSFIDMVGNGGIDQLQITLDGSEREHDQRRTLATGEGTFWKIFSNIDASLRSGAKVSLRINLDEQNLGGLEALAGRILDAGWSTFHDFSCQISFTQQIQPSPNKYGVGNPESDDSRRADFDCAQSARSFNPAQRIELQKMLSKSTKVFLTPTDVMKGQFREVFRTKKAFRFRSAYCGAVAGSFIFDPKGDIYTCWESAGKITNRVGRFMPDLDMDTEALSRWRNRTICALAPCRKCKYSLFCGGGCAVFAERSYATSNRPYCDGFPALFHFAAQKAFDEEFVDMAPELGGKEHGSPSFV